MCLIKIYFAFNYNQCVKGKKIPDIFLPHYKINMIHSLEFLSTVYPYLLCLRILMSNNLKPPFFVVSYLSATNVEKSRTLI